ncbi:helix-turn-helix domain containing protein [Bacteroidales bacterium OttesenSCG-928-A17]|nr:helix-turn-helix domain containing protein [Bacteroidales bacterium OttesenSCG-928-A17]
MKDRIKKIMEREGLNPASFADILDINRQTMIATLNRNKIASINIVMAVLEKFPDINSDWLLFGKGPMTKGGKVVIQSSLFEDEDSTIEPEETYLENTEKIPTVEPKKYEYPQDSPLDMVKSEDQAVYNQINIPQKNTNRKIDKIVVFYDDKTFMTLIPEE